MGKKYIIELESGTHIFVLGPEGIVHIGEPDVVYETVDGMQIGDAVINAEPYTEPDLEQVRKEAYADGYNTGFGRKIDASYQEGLSDAWKAVRKIIKMPEGDLLNIFTECYSAVCTALQVILKYDAPEAIEKIRQYEQEKDAEINIGNEVKAFEKKPFIVTGFGYGDDVEDVYCHGFVTENGISTSAKKNSCVRTGRHFPEIAEIFEKMRGEQDE